MCGFGGIVNSSREFHFEEVARIAKSVSHRGPDSTGIVLLNQHLQETRNSGSSALFFNRLSIIDLDARANQPFQSERYTLLFNGEIYNYKDLKKELTSKGIAFKTTSDTEVLFYSLQTWGVDALSKLNGMFAFFWIDKKERTFLLSRDRVGIKPLLYKFENGSLIFGSELNSIVRFSKSDAKISQTAIHNFLCLQYVPSPSTIFEDIFKLEPGHYLAGTISDLDQKKRIATKPYWDGYDLPSPKKFDKEDLENILTQSIRRQLEADVPLGLFLSSGVDSSLITALINKNFKGRPYDFFTVAFDQKTESDESESASDYLNGFNSPDLRHHRLTINPRLISQRLTSMYDYVDEPFGDPATLLNWVISEKAREHVTVVLSGDGADELFWGYPRYNEWVKKLGRWYKKFPRLETVGRLVSQMPDSRVKYKLMELPEADPITVYFNMLRPKLFGFLPSVLENSNLWFQKGLPKVSQRKDLPAIIDLKTYLPDAMLYKVDRASMASSLEVRVPFLDNEVIDYALSLSFEDKSTETYKTKSALKKLLTSIAPHYDIMKPKKGFNFPLTSWLKSDWKELVQDTITKQALEDLGLSSSRMLSILDGFYRKEIKSTYEVWHVFNLLLWQSNRKKDFAKNE